MSSSKAVVTPPRSSKLSVAAEMAWSQFELQVLRKSGLSHALQAQKPCAATAGFGSCTQVAMLHGMGVVV